MNNEFLTVVNYLKGILESDNRVELVTHGVSNDIDLDKNSNFCLTPAPRLWLGYQSTVRKAGS